MGARHARPEVDSAGLTGGEGVRVKTDRSGALQYGALPWRREADEIQILLITSRETQRWVIPKGWPMDGQTPAEAAAIEAYEEAGLKGVMGSSLGTYCYGKRFKDQTIRDLCVEVFPLEVAGELTFWPEAQQRRRRWFSIAAAAAAVDEPELADIISRFAP